MTLKRLLAVAPVVLVVGCQSPLEPSGSSAGISGSPRPAVQPEGTTGGGRLLVSGSIETAFTFNAVQTGTGVRRGACTMRSRSRACLPSSTAASPALPLIP